MTRYALIIPDSTPLITLAAADALDLLLKPRIGIVVPDGVYWEVTRYADLPGATEIKEWIERSGAAVSVKLTDEYIRHQKLIDLGAKRVKNLGERCAAEIVDAAAEADPDGRFIILYEDSDVQNLRILNPRNVDTLTTADFLAELEHARLIQSADQILHQAVAGGRHDRVRHRSGGLTGAFTGDDPGVPNP